EPTNHLDLRAKDVLLEALQEFTGTVVFVSHDRYFIDKLATRVFEVADGRVTVYPGNYEDYMWRLAQAAATAAPQAEAAAASAAPERPRPAAEKRLNPIKLRQLQDRQTEIEEEVARLEAEIADTEAALSNFVSADETMRLAAVLDDRRGNLQRLMEEWEEVASTIEANS
ncbi:MAG: ABC transporter ATP-binding protein, partial [Bryobacteraceae bacterium]